MKPPTFTALFEAPLWQDVRPILQHYTVSDYAHTINAVGGYWSSSIGIPSRWLDTESWLERGLGRHVKVLGDALDIIWEGFVNQITAGIGPLTVTVGPLLSIANRARTIYATLDTSVTGEPIVGMRKITEDADSAASTANWPIIPAVLNAGTCSLLMAEAMRDLHLTKFAFPQVNKQLAIPGGAEPVVRLECLGYVHLLNYPVFYATSGEVDGDAKILEALSQTPNSAWLTYGTDHIDSNTVQVDAFENEDRLALNVIQEVVALGDGSGNRWMFGVYNGREAWYQTIPTSIEYISRVANARLQVEGTSGQPIPPWNVRPGKWLKVPDYLPLKSSTVNLAEDPRLMFIEEVNFTSPWALSLSEGGVGKPDQLLAQMGLGGGM